MMFFTDSWGWFGWIGMILWWALVVLAAVALVRWIAGQSGSARGKSARELLEERYARGEITKEEFEEKRRTLKE